MTLAIPLREWFGVGPGLLFACSFATAGCDPGAAECSCHPTGLLLQICPDLAQQVQQIELTGTACATATRRVVDASAEGGWTRYDIQPSQTGSCSVEVFFKNGLTFTANADPSPLTIIRGPGCCSSGLYPDPLSAGDIQACPQSDAAADSETLRDSASGS
jgi:hypothetical protein